MKTLQHFIPALVLLLVMTLMVSCSQDKAIESIEDSTNSAVAKELILPLGYAQKDQEEIQAYMESLDEEAFGALMEHTRIAYFLEEIGIREKVEKTMEEGDLYSGLDLTTILTDAQLKSMKMFTTDQYRPSTRPCGQWHYNGTVHKCVEWVRYWQHPYGYLYYCARYGTTCEYWRSCSNWPYIQYRYGCLI